MKIRSDFVSNSSSSSFIFIIHGDDYCLGHNCTDVCTRGLSSIISYTNVCGPVDIISDDEFKNNWISYIFSKRGYASFYDLSLDKMPRSLFNSIPSDAFDMYGEDHAAIDSSYSKEVTDYLIKLLEPEYGDITGVCYSVSDYDEESGEWIDESTGFDYIPVDAIFRTYSNNH